MSSGGSSWRGEDDWLVTPAPASRLYPDPRIRGSQGRGERRIAIIANIVLEIINNKNGGKKHNTRTIQQLIKRSFGFILIRTKIPSYKMQGPVFPHCRVNIIRELMKQFCEFPDSLLVSRVIPSLCCVGTWWSSSWVCIKHTQPLRLLPVRWVFHPGQNISATGNIFVKTYCDCKRMKAISYVIIFTGSISVSKTQDIDLDGAVSDKVGLSLEERSSENNYTELLWEPLFFSEHGDRLQRGRGGGGRRDLRDQGGGEGGPGAGDGGAVHPAECDAVLQHLRHQVSRHGPWD